MIQRRKPIVGLDFLALADGQTQLFAEIKARFGLTIAPDELSEETTLGKRLINAANPEAVAWLRQRERSPEFLLALAPFFDLAALQACNLDLDLKVLVRARHAGNRERYHAVSTWLASRGLSARVDLIEAHDGWASQVKPDLIICERATHALALCDQGMNACAIARPDNFGHVLTLLSPSFEIAALLPHDEENEEHEAPLSRQSPRDARDNLRSVGRRRGSGGAGRRERSRRGLR